MKQTIKYSSFHNLLRTSLIMLVMLFISNSASAQNVESQPKEVEAQTSVSSSEMELVLWFMGTKKCKTSAGFSEDEVQSRKKQIITSGMTPNRILTRTFMNKAINYETSIV